MNPARTCKVRKATARSPSGLVPGLRRGLTLPRGIGHWEREDPASPGASPPPSRTLKKHFSNEQIKYTLRRAEAGTPLLELFRKHGITRLTFYRWKRRFVCLGAAELARFRQIEDEIKLLTPPSPG
jgi:putative transposase